MSDIGSRSDGSGDDGTEMGKRKGARRGGKRVQQSRLRKKQQHDGETSGQQQEASASGGGDRDEPLQLLQPPPPQPHSSSAVDPAIVSISNNSGVKNMAQLVADQLAARAQQKQQAAEKCDLMSAGSASQDGGILGNKFSTPDQLFCATSAASTRSESKNGSSAFSVNDSPWDEPRRSPTFSGGELGGHQPFVRPTGRGAYAKESQEIAARTLFIRFIPLSIPCKDFRALVLSFGEPSRIRICAAKQAEVNWTYGFVEYKQLEAAKAAQRTLDGKRMDTFRLACTFAKSPINDNSPMDATSRCNCSFGLENGDAPLQSLLKRVDHNKCHQDDFATADGGARKHKGTLGAGNDGLRPPKSSIQASSLLEMFSRSVGKAIFFGRSFCANQGQTHYYDAVAELQNASAYSAELQGASLTELQQRDFLETRLTMHVTAMALHAQHNSIGAMVAAAEGLVRATPATESIAPSQQVQGHLLNIANLLATAGLVAEGFSKIVARCCYSMAQRRALDWLKLRDKDLDTDLDECRVLYARYCPNPLMMYPTILFNREGGIVRSDGTTSTGRSPIFAAKVYRIG